MYRIATPVLRSEAIQPTSATGKNQAMLALSGHVNRLWFFTDLAEWVYRRVAQCACALSTASGGEHITHPNLWDNALNSGIVGLSPGKT